jgi:hypothetical protein
MSHESRLGGLLSTERIDVTVAKLGVVFSVLALGLRLLAEQVFLVVIPVATGVACALYVAVRSERFSSHGTPTLSGAVAGSLPPVTLLGLAGVVLLTHRAGARTVPVYVLTGLVGTGILAQILFVGENHFAHGVVFAQILTAGVVTRLTALYSSPGFVGVDVWTHVPVWVDGIARTGSLVPLAESKYIMAPLYHVFGAVGTFVFGTARDGVFLTMGLLLPLSAVFVYLAATVFVGRRWSLLAVALYTFGDQFVRWGIHIIPTSLGLVLFLALLYSVSKLFDTDAAPWTVGVSLLFGLAVVFTHQVSTAVVLTFLAVAVAGSLFADALAWREAGTGISRPTLSVVSVFVVTLVTTVISWSVTPYAGDRRFIWRRLNVLRRTILQEAGFLNLASESSTAPTVAASNETLAQQAIPYVELFGFTLLLSGAVLGGLVVLRSRDRVAVSFTHLLSAAVMFVIVFGMSIFGIRVLLPGRWMAFFYAPLVVLCAVGVGYVATTAPRRVLVAAFLLLALGYPTTMVVAEKATLDSPAFDDTHIRFSYTEPELAAVETIQAIYPASLTERIATDHPYQTLFRQIAPYEGGTIVMSADGPVGSEPVVYRHYQSTDGPAFNRAEENPLPYTQEALTAEEVCQPGRNHVYANDAVDLCTATTVTGEVAL